jgi:very-short-patch-repair endonuclease
VKQVYPEAVLEYRVGNRSMDICIESKRLDIEYDGDYWHRDRDRDAIRDAELAAMGWRTVRIRKADLYALRRNPALIRYL